MNILDLSHLCETVRAELPDAEILGPDVRVSGLAGDSRRVEPGDLFVATPGVRDDGLAYVAEALRRGAIAIVGRERPETLPDGVPFLKVHDVRFAKALLACEYFGHPSKRLRVVGITGTNGKTTTAFMLRAIMTMDGISPGLVGTLGAYIGRDYVPLANTTPDAIELQRLLAQMVDQNLQTAIMEVSSHALAQGRVHGIDFDVGVFTNLSADHLDYHVTMEDYATAKGGLFERLPPEATAVLNIADPISERYRRITRARVMTYAIEQDADLRGDITRLDAEGTVVRFRHASSGLSLGVSMRLVGRHNVENALSAVAAALALDLPPSAIGTGLSSMTCIPGRLEPVDCGQDFRVFVDYAHTPDALEQVLTLLRPLTRGQLRVVFGCGGDRDRTKRPMMGRAAAESADHLYVTSDNPRTEDPEAILDEVLAGIDSDATSAKVTRQPDRRAAIEQACRAARGGDIVVIAGKGHETAQIVGTELIPFDDREVARDVLWRL